MISVSEQTKDRVKHLFPESMAEQVQELLLTRCGDNLPLVETSCTELAERIRFAVLKLSDGNLADLKKNIDAAQQDWRDVLMAAGFGENETAHRDWIPREGE